MLKRFLLLMLAHLVLICMPVSGQGLFEIVREYPVMDRFYRNMPLLADNYYKNPESILLQVPSFLNDENLSFKYKKREGYQYELLFSDNVNIVRFLGGWSAIKYNTTIEEISKWDLAYRDPTGKIQYRWELISARLDPVLQLGYSSPNIVLDNIPWCFPETPWEPADGEGYGQANPPQNLNEWKTFISELCTELVRRYGFERVNTWGFRLGTEAGGKTRFNGTDEQYRSFYKATALAITAVLPDARVFPYNRAGQGHENLKTLLSECKKEGIQYSASPISTYSIARTDETTGKINTNSVNPDITAEGAATKMWYEMDAITDPSLLSREIHEYGWFLQNELGDRDNAPGARGAAGNFHYIMNLRSKRLDKLFHWSVIDPNGEWQKVILNSQGFIYSIWDYCTGARTVELNKTLKYAPQSTQMYKCVGYFHKTGKSYIMVSGYNMDRKQQNRNRITLYIPRSEFYEPQLMVNYTTLNDSTDHYRMLRNDLAAKSLLYTDYSNDGDYVPQYNTMSAQGKWWLQKDNEKYTTRIKENLTLKPFKGTAEITNEGTIISFDISTPELLVLSLEKSKVSKLKNPAEELCKVSLTPTDVKNTFIIEGAQLEYISLYSADGKCVLQKKISESSNLLNIDILNAGMYLACIHHNGVVTNKRLFKL